MQGSYVFSCEVFIFFHHVMPILIFCNLNIHKFLKTAALFKIS